MINNIKIATRKSPLAMWQAKFIRRVLLESYPTLQIELIQITTQGDKILDSSLTQYGGKGLFVKELETSLLTGDADIAVHSMKDMPACLPSGLHWSVICPRSDPHDALVSNHYQTVADLPSGAKVGTSSLRRQCQLRAYRPDLAITPLRGNVGTRLAKLDAGDYDAIILAAAGLKRLDFCTRISSTLAPEQHLPAIGQGTLAIEFRADDRAINHLISPLKCSKTWMVACAERAMNKRLGAGCQAPIAGYALLQNDTIWLRGLVGQTNGNRLLRAEIRGEPDHAESLGIALADTLLSKGADKILANLNEI